MSSGRKNASAVGMTHVPGVPRGHDVALTDEAITRLRGMIQSGQLPPGARLPPEHQLALQMGISRSGVREAVKVLESARVLDVRRGDGTYVTSLAPRLLLEGIGFAFELLQGDTLLEVMEVRRLLEPTATSLAAVRMSEEQLEELGAVLASMRRWPPTRKRCSNWTSHSTAWSWCRPATRH